MPKSFLNKRYKQERIEKPYIKNKSNKNSIKRYYYNNNKTLVTQSENNSKVQSVTNCTNMLTENTSLPCSVKQQTKTTTQAIKPINNSFVKAKQTFSKKQNSNNLKKVLENFIKTRQTTNNTCKNICKTTICEKTEKQQTEQKKQNTECVVKSVCEKTEKKQTEQKQSTTCFVKILPKTAEQTTKQIESFVNILPKTAEQTVKQIGNFVSILPKTAEPKVPKVKQIFNSNIKDLLLFKNPKHSVQSEPNNYAKAKQFCNSNETKNNETKHPYLLRFKFEPRYYSNVTQEQIKQEEQNLKTKLFDVTQRRPITIHEYTQLMLNSKQEIRERVEQTKSIIIKPMTNCCFNHTCISIFDKNNNSNSQTNSEKNTYIFSIENMLSNYKQKLDPANFFYVRLYNKLKAFEYYNKNDENFYLQSKKNPIWNEITPNLVMNNCYKFINANAKEILKSSNLLTKISHDTSYIIVLAPDVENKIEFMQNYIPSSQNTEVVVGKILKEYYNNNSVLRIVTCGCKKLIPDSNKVYILVPEPIVTQGYLISNIVVKKPIFAFFYSFWAEHNEFPFYVTEFRVNCNTNMSPVNLTNTNAKYKKSYLSTDLNNFDALHLQNLKTKLYQRAFQTLDKASKCLQK